MIRVSPVDASGHLHDPSWYPNGPTCWHCGADRVGHRANLGLCHVCYNRWMDNGFPAGGPPPPRPGGRGWKLDDPLVLTEFARLDRKGEPGNSATLAQRFGVTRRTLTRWRRRLEQPEPDRAEVAAT